MPLDANPADTVDGAVAHDVGTPILGLATDAAGNFALSLEDGRIIVGACTVPAEGIDLTIHEGVSLGLCAAPDGGFVSGGDDGRAVLVAGDGAVTELLPVGRTWVGAVAASREARLIGLGVGKELKLFDVQGTALGTAPPAPSAITAVAFNPKGKRVGVSHYGGVTLWWSGGLGGTPKPLAWKGSHIAMTWSPDGRFVATATQEKELHGWKVDEGGDFRMSGYAVKVKSLSWTADGRWLACSGAPVATLWDFQGKGPMGRQPIEMGGGGDGGNVAQVACHPRHPVCAIMFDDGRVELGRIGVADGTLLLKEPGGKPAALAWSADGGTLLAATQEGVLTAVPLPDLKANPTRRKG